MALALMKALCMLHRYLQAFCAGVGSVLKDHMHVLVNWDRSAEMRNAIGTT